MSQCKPLEARASSGLAPDTAPTATAGAMPAPRVEPVFSVFVAGHRQQRLERYWLDAGEPTIRMQQLEQALAQVLSCLRTQAGQAFRATEHVYAPTPPRFRLLTGLASGTDELAARTADVLGFELQLLVPQDRAYCEQRLTRLTGHVERGVAMGMVARGEHSELPQHAFTERDDLALGFSDLLIAVWDGREPDELASGTAFMIRDALLRRQPVVLLHLDPTADTPRILVSDPAALTEVKLIELKVLGAGGEALLGAFSAVGADTPLDALLAPWIECTLLPFRPALDPDSAENRLLARIDRQCSVSAYVGQWLRHGWRRMTRRRGGADSGGVADDVAETPPLAPLEWARGSWLWLQIMLNPPRKSQPLRILECLSPARAHTRQEWIINRAHGFFSAIGRFDRRAAVRALRTPPTSNRYRDIRPEAQAAEVHPIVEPALEHTFNWSDGQARAFSTRYRDDTWLIYFAAAFAVFCAVAGAIHLWPASKTGIPFVWVFTEFVLLHFIVRRVLKSRFRDYHGRWMGFRFIAEQLRYLRLGYPLLVLPRTFNAPFWEPVTAPQASRSGAAAAASTTTTSTSTSSPPDTFPAGHAQSAGMRLVSAEQWLLQRILIAEGLPRDAAGRTLYEMTAHNPETLRYIDQVLEEHRDYYHRSYHSLQHDHHILHRIAISLFTLTFIAVTLHFFFYLSWILIFTAFFPAWGAAIHGILTQNEVVRVSAMSGHVWQRLTTLTEAFRVHRGAHGTRPIESDAPDQRWARTQDLRILVANASEILSDANSYWRSLLQHNQPNLPA